MAFGSELGLIRFNCFKELYKNSFYPSNLILNAAYLMTSSRLGSSSSSALGVSQLMRVLFRSPPFIPFCRTYAFYRLPRNPEELANTQKISSSFLIVWEVLSLPQAGLELLAFLSQPPNHRDCRCVPPPSHGFRILLMVSINVIKDALGQALTTSITSSSILGENYFYYPWFMIN